MAPIVDVHCHTFNADDLPVRGFVYHLQLHKIPVGKLLSKLVDHLVQGAAPNYGSDLARLDSLLGPSDGFEAAPVVEPQSADQFEQEVNAAMAALQTQDPDLLVDVGTALARTDATAAGPLVPAAGADVGDESALDWYSTARRAVLWVKLFARSRLDLVADYVRTFDDEIDLATPLLVDLGTGLGDVAKTSVAQQVELYEKLSRATMLGKLPGGGKLRVHPFVGFDPLRELRARKVEPIRTPLAIVQDAVREWGFVGVKLYPQMGWRPSGNTAWRAVSDGDASRLDAIVDELAGWCEAEDVPLTAHCADSNYADDHFQGYGGPDDWLPVLASHPGLHLNLGHFGGAHAKEADDGWPWKIARAAATAPHLYADVGNHRIDDDKLATAYFTMLKTMFAAPATQPIADRVMFGSDWFMEAIHPEADDFLNTYRDRFTASFGAPATERFLGGAALSFLGFDDATNQNAKRLVARYERFASANMPSWLAQ